MADCVIADESGCASMRLRGDFAAELKPDTGLSVRNAKVVMIQNKIRIEIDKFGKVELLDEVPANTNEKHNVSEIE